MLVQQGEARKALEVLQRPNVTVDLVVLFYNSENYCSSYHTKLSFILQIGY
jgi:hypothetical protein